MSKRQVIVIGGGAAGYFGAIACAEANPDCAVTIYEATAHLLAKVKVSGGGRCNVTHACFEPRELVKRYPRGSRELLGAFHRWQPRDTVEWFAQRGVELKTEEDGRMFPVTDSSQTIVDCLQAAAAKAGVIVKTHCGVKLVERVYNKKMERAAPGAFPASTSPVSAGDLGHNLAEREKENAGQDKNAQEAACATFRLTLVSGEVVHCDRLLVATGGNRTNTGFEIARQFGHTIVPPVPSLFTFNIKDPRLDGIPGVAVEEATTFVRGTNLKERGPLLVTHWGLSGPAVLKISAWGARLLSERDYKFTLGVNWAPAFTLDTMRSELERARAANPKKQIGTWCPVGLPSRLWEKLIQAAGIALTAQWATIPGNALRTLAAQITECEFSVTGKSTFKDEFVTCGGVKLSEVDFKTFESRLVPGLHFAGEVLDVDGITGGFNFQAAWTGGILGGRAMAE